MGVTISSKCGSYDMGYATFGRLRMDIADHIDDNFGKMYREMYSSFDASTADILEYINTNAESLNLNQETIDFLFESDCDGKIPAKNCMKILSCIETMKNNKEYGYAGQKQFGISMMTIDLFKKLLQDSAKRRVVISWC